MRPKQPWLQAMQARISSVRPSRALIASSGSAIWARTMPIMSACPSASTFSARAGSLMRPGGEDGERRRHLEPAARGTV